MGTHRTRSGTLTSGSQFRCPKCLRHKGSPSAARTTTMEFPRRDSRVASPKGASHAYSGWPEAEYGVHGHRGSAMPTRHMELPGRLCLALGISLS